MKKQIVTALGISLAILAGSFLTIAIKNASATIPSSDTTLAIETTSSLVNTAPLATQPIQITPKHQTIYAITNHTGTVQQSFINNTINSSDATLPISLDVKYYLDGTEISATDLAHHSGHVRFEYHYTSTKAYQEKLIPFVALTGLTLDHTKFTNLKLNNGKIISDDNNLAIIGYSLVGLNENFGIDFLDDTFTIEADVTDFTLDSTYTIATNELFADIDTSRLTSIDELISSINQLSSGLDQIISGASKISDGLGQLLDGILTLKSTVDSVTGKILTITGKAETILHDFNTTIATGREIINQIPSTSDFINEDIETIAEKYDLPEEAVAELETLINDKYTDAYSKFSTHVDRIDSVITSGTDTASSYIAKVKSSTTELRDGVTALANGANQLHDGSIMLENGLLTFKSQGIDRLVDFANHDLNNFALNLRKTIEAASSYRSYDNSSTTSVKFVFKTPSIK